MLIYLTLILLLASLVHLFLAVYNRWLLCITDGPMKPVIIGLWFLVSLFVPSILAILFAETEPYRSIFLWKPTAEVQPLFLVMVGVVALFLARLPVWLHDKFADHSMEALISESVSQPPLPPVASTLPRILRSFETTGDLHVVRREISVSGLAPAFDGFTIAHVADVHFGQRLKMENYFEAVQHLVASLNADVVVLTGDFIDKRRDIVRSVEYHARFKGRLGTLCVLGNHDYWTRPDKVIEELKKTSVKWLGSGQRRVLKRDGRRLIFTGTDAPWDSSRVDYDRLIRRGTGDAVVLLSHTPDNAPAAARAGASLILSGHNHGGQVCLPGLGPLIVPSRYGLRYSGGLYRVGADSLLNVSRGVGVSRGGVRMLCPPEIVLLTLRASTAEAMVGKVITASDVFKRPATVQQGSWARLPAEGKSQ